MRAGLVGGLGPEATIDYYRRILALWRREGLPGAPPVVIDSVDVDTVLRLSASDHAALVEYLLESLSRLAGAGVAFAAITANTPHLVFDELALRSPVPLVSIVETCVREIQRLSLTRVGLLGARFTMEAPFYPEACARRGITLVVPDAADREWVHDCYVNQLVKGVFSDETREKILALVGRLQRDEGVGGVILGGTELSVLIPPATASRVPLLDTTALHVAAIVRRLGASA